MTANHNNTFLTPFEANNSYQKYVGQNTTSNARTLQNFKKGINRTEKCRSVKVTLVEREQIDMKRGVTDDHCFNSEETNKATRERSAI